MLSAAVVARDHGCVVAAAVTLCLLMLMLRLLLPRTAAWSAAVVVIFGVCVFVLGIVSVASRGRVGGVATLGLHLGRIIVGAATAAVGVIVVVVFVIKVVVVVAVAVVVGGVGGVGFLASNPMYAVADFVYAFFPVVVWYGVDAFEENALLLLCERQSYCTI